MLLFAKLLEWRDERDIAAQAPVIRHPAGVRSASTYPRDNAADLRERVAVEVDRVRWPSAITLADGAEIVCGPSLNERANVRIANLAVVHVLVLSSGSWLHSACRLRPR